MNKEQRYQAVQTNIKDLLDKAANDKSAGGVVGLGSAWLAAELYVKNEQGHQREIMDKPVEGVTDANEKPPV
jgi:hypothetical protein